ncbi:MAG: GxxExxY protein [Verrucomicrobia bacterium]|nr:GxxExxY protein [Verrucomicrobiota bacterium]
MSGVSIEDVAFEARKALEEVYSTLGPGFDVEPYKKAFAQELTRRDIPYERDKLIPVLYKGATVGGYTLDFVLRDRLFVRLAAEGGHPGLLKMQVASAIKAAKLKLGVLLDMNAQTFKMHQVVNPDFVLGGGGGADISIPDEEEPESLPRQRRKPGESDAVKKLFSD